MGQTAPDVHARTSWRKRPRTFYASWVSPTDRGRPSPPPSPACARGRPPGAPASQASVFVQSGLTGTRTSVSPTRAWAPSSRCNSGCAPPTPCCKRRAMEPPSRPTDSTPAARASALMRTAYTRFSTGSGVGPNRSRSSSPMITASSVSAARANRPYAPSRDGRSAM